MAFYNPLDPAFVPSVDPSSVGFGFNTLLSVTTGTHNTAIGNKALTAITTGGSNIALGGLSGSDITTGSNNTVVGHNTGSLITTGSSNTVVGYSVGSTTLTTGSNNILIGTSNSTDAATSSTSNTFVLSGGATAIMSATGINGTPAVTIPGTLAVTGGFSGQITGIGSTVGGVANASYTQVSSTTNTNIAGMSVPVVVGTYVIKGYVSCQCAAGSGIKLNISGGNSVLSASLVDTWAYSTTTITGQSNISSVGSNIIASAITATAVEFTGTIVVSTAGTLALEAAQAVSGTTALTISNNSYMTATRIA